MREPGWPNKALCALQPGTLKACSPMKTESYPGITFVAITYGKAEILHSTMFRTSFADFLSKVWLVIRDEGQQAGPSSKHLPFGYDPKVRLRGMDRGLQATRGGVARNRELKLQHAKRCGLRMISRQPVRPSQVEKLP